MGRVVENETRRRLRGIGPFLRIEEWVKERRYGVGNLSSVDEAEVTESKAGVDEGVDTFDLASEVNVKAGSMVNNGFLSDDSESCPYELENVLTDVGEVTERVSSLRLVDLLLAKAGGRLQVLTVSLGRFEPGREEEVDGVVIETVGRLCSAPKVGLTGGEDKTPTVLVILQVKLEPASRAWGTSAIMAGRGRYMQ